MKSCVLVLLFLNAILECENSIVYRRYARPTRQISDANDNITIANAVTEIFNECKCVDYYLCDEDNYIITDGRTIIEERMQSSGGRTLCEGGRYTGEIVCCKNRSTATLKESGIDLNNDADGFIDNLTLTTNLPIEANSMGVKPTIKTKIISCGTQLPTINIRIFAGEDELTPINGEFPWLAAIFRNVNGNYQLHCAGSLIHPKVVLTANHCVKRYRPGDLKVSINGNIEQPTIEENSQTAATKDVSEIIKHADYSSGTLSNDIALLILTEPIPINRTIHNVNTICLPPNENHVNDLKCLVAGWGRTPNNKGQKVLKKVELPTVSNERCQRLLRNTRLGPGFDLDKSFMCAGGEEGKDACKGDGGSPLMCPFNDSDRYFQAGIVSWGIGCGSKNVPGVYTKVSQFRDWIKEELGKRQISLINTV